MIEEKDDIEKPEETEEEEALDLLEEKEDENSEDENAEDEDEDEDEDDEDEDLEADEELEPALVEGPFTMAIVRMPSPTLADGLTSKDLGRPDYALFLQQHLSYTAVLRSLGLKIIKLPSLPDYPDAHFVEDVAVITPEVAVITRPGAAAAPG